MLLLLLSLWRLWLQSYSRRNNDMHESKEKNKFVSIGTPKPKGIDACSA
ncbi:unnamed protein product [Musa banksii]